MLTAWMWGVAAAAEGSFLVRETTLFDRGMSLFGIGALIGVAWILSDNRGRIDWRPVRWGVALQLLIGLIVLSPMMSEFFYTVVNDGVNKLLSFSEQGATFVFQSIVPHQIADANGQLQPVRGVSPPVKTFAFWILPTIVFFSSLMSVLYYLGVMQFVVRVLAVVMVRTLGTSGAESLSAAGNIFVGQTEAPLLVRPFIATMTRSELMAVMTGGFATVAGGVMGAYVQFLSAVPNIAGHLVIASLMSAPAALAIAKVMVPETEEPLTRGEVKLDAENPASNVIEAAALGAADGMKLAINVAAMLMAIVGLVALVDWSISLIPVRFCDAGVTLGWACSTGVGAPLDMSMVFGWLFAPIALLMGVPWDECVVVGRLLGEKIVFTEFIAYIHLGEIVSSGPPQISERSAIIASYALCGFANFASIGIQLGGIGGIAPERMSDLANLGFRAMFAGVLAACMTGAVVGLII
jgi:CNT family concentrative nucleoside transporter